MSRTQTIIAASGFASVSLLAVLACGRVDDGTRAADAATAAPTSTTTPGPTASPPIDLPLDAAVRDAAHPDGGPPPTFPCADAAPELRCPLPASSCIDDHWMRYYTNPQCDESTGECRFVPIDLECLPAEVPPDCFMGGCRAVVIR